MLIAIDCRTALARKTGDRTYTLNLLRGLAKLHQAGEVPHDWRFQLLLDAPDTESVLPESPIFETQVLRAPNSRLWTLWALPIHARRARLDLVHVQYLAPWVLNCPFVCTIHDVVWRVLPQTFPTKDRIVMRALMPSAARRAARILTGTHSSQNDIARFLRVPKSKIGVTPYAVDEAFYAPVAPERIEAVRAKYRLGNAPYILSVGVQQPRKNVPRLIAAFLQLKAAHPDWPHQLVVTGKRGWGKTSSPTTHHPSLNFTGYVADDELPALYSGAQVFAYPSLYEGFGLPIIEAQACGCPVLTSNRSSMAEVAGDAAQLVDPRSVESIARGLETLMQDGARREELKQLGLKRAHEFSIEMQARATLEEYRLALRDA